MTPETAVAALDRHLARNGAPATLRRYTGLGAARVASDVTVQAHVRGYAPEELVGGIVQGGSKAILSPTQIAAAAWPGPQGWPEVGDKLVVDGRERNVTGAVPMRMAGRVVRIELQVDG